MSNIPESIQQKLNGLRIDVGEDIVKDLEVALEVEFTDQNMPVKKQDNRESFLSIHRQQQKRNPNYCYKIME